MRISSVGPEPFFSKRYDTVSLRAVDVLADVIGDGVSRGAQLTGEPRGGLRLIVREFGAPMQALIGRHQVRQLLGDKRGHVLREEGALRRDQTTGQYKSFVLHRFSYCSSAIAASVMAVTPVRRVGSGDGAKNGECAEGSATPVRSLSATFAGSYAPSQKMTAGMV